MANRSLINKILRKKTYWMTKENVKVEATINKRILYENISQRNTKGWLRPYKSQRKERKRK